MGGSGRSGGGARDGGRGGAGPETPVARALAAALYGGADDDAALDTGASLLAAADPDEAGRELLLRGEEYVRRAWKRGWLPADLDREARRQELDPAARTALAELTAAELARYGNGLTPLWRRQLDALAAPAWAGTGGRDRFARATAVLQALRLLLRLPALEPLGPPRAGTRSPPPWRAGRG
ncbi:aromatic acid decarboxylase, partial [Streptomyces sp. McG5]|nr:aromatic acid decarboxylase [Streptomyces sp. McG5]